MSGYRWLTVFGVLVGSVGMAWAQEPEGPAEQEKRLEFRIEGKAHYRSSDAASFPSPFVFSESQLPPGAERAFFGVVDPGDSFEISTVTLYVDAHFGGFIDARLKVDAIDLYDRNPTSGDRQVDVDEAWIRFGRETPAGSWSEGSSFYTKIGKMAKFERQNDRHTESYGLVSTAFNRFEDTGIELGADLGRHVYLRLSATQGNPLFIRDPNALAGDNGIDGFQQPNPDPELDHGIVILYDAEVEDINVDGDLELGAGLGLRLGSPDSGLLVDLLGWYYERELAERVDLEGTFYGGDLDVLNGPAPGFGLPIVGNDKSEIGLNVRLHWDNLTVFGQWVDQEVAGLDRLGYEAEVAWRFDLPLVWAVGGKQLFPSVQPVVRYSRLEPEFEGGSPRFPAPSLRWEWDKVDYGVRVVVVDGVDVTAEFADNTFVRQGVDESADEVLVTLRFRR